MNDGMSRDGGRTGPTPEKAALRPVHTVLAAVRARLRRRHLLRALGIVVAATCAALVVSFLMDWLLELPLAVRAVHLAIAAVALFALAAATLAPLRRNVPETDVAQAVEAIRPRLKDRLASALDFERRLDDPAEPESRELMERVVQSAAAEAQKLQPRLLVTMRRARPALLAGLAGVCVLGITALAAGDAFSLWVSRGLLLRDIQWPRRTRMTVLDFPSSGEKTITRGDDLRVVARAKGARPREVVLHFEALEFGAEGGDPRVTDIDTRTMHPLVTEDGDTGDFALDFRAVPASFRFWVTGGDDDDRDPVYVVRAAIPPRIASIAAEITYPEHTNRPPEVFREASFEVIEGSRVVLSLRASMPLAAARMLPEGSESRDLPLTDDGARLRIDLGPVINDLDFKLDLTAESGQRNRPGEDRFLIRAVTDDPPDVRVLHPVTRIYRTPTSVLPVKVAVTDDFGITDVTIAVQAEGQPRLGRSLLPADGGAAAATKHDIYAPLEMSQLGTADNPVRAGDLLTLLLFARDNAGQEAAAPDISIEVLSREELERRLGQRQVGLRDQLLQVRTHQRRALDELRALASDVEKGTRGSAEVGRARDLQVEQGRVSGDLERFLDGIHRVFDAYVLNRLGSGPTVDRLLPMYHRALSGPVGDDGSVFPRSLYREVVDEKRAGRLYDPEVLGALLDIMDLGDTAVLDLSPGIHSSLREWAQSPVNNADQMPLALSRAEELARKLEELERRMDRWEDLAEIIELAREIRDRQGDISRPYQPEDDDER